MHLGAGTHLPLATSILSNDAEYFAINRPQVDLRLKTKGQANAYEAITCWNIKRHANVQHMAAAPARKI